MNGQEPDLRKIDAIFLFFVTIVMLVFGYTRSAAFPNDLPVQNPPTKVTHDRGAVQNIKLDR
jgi:hypothetical protein